MALPLGSRLLSELVVRKKAAKRNGEAGGTIKYVGEMQQHVAGGAPVGDQYVGPAERLDEDLANGGNASSASA